jgi:hypothetical protein
MTSGESAVKIVELTKESQVRAWIAEGLGYSACFGVSVRLESGRFPGFAETLTGWYLPLLRKGFALPFFVVLDLGMAFFDSCSGIHPRLAPPGSAETSVHSPALAKDLAKYSRLINNLFGQPSLIAMADQIQLASRAGGAKEGRLRRFHAAGLFLEHCLTALDSLAFARVRCAPELITAVAEDQTAMKNLDLNLVGASNDFRDAFGVTNPNQLFLHSLAEYAANAAGEELLDGATTRLVLSAGAGIDQPSELDLLLLKNYEDFYLLPSTSLSFNQLKTLQRLSRVRLPSRSRKKAGGYYGISSHGDWGSLLGSEWGTLAARPELFLNNLYNHQMLYYDRSQPITHPLKVALVVLVDHSPALRRKRCEEGPFGSLANELAAYLCEDTLRALASLGNVTFYACLAHFGGPAVPDVYCLNLSEAQRALAKEGLPVLGSLPQAVAAFFRLQSALLPAPEASAEVSLGETASVALRQAQLALERCMERQATDDEPERDFDSAHLVVISDRQGQRSLFQKGSFLAGLHIAAHRQDRHVFEIGIDGVNWYLSPRLFNDQCVPDATESYKSLRGDKKSSAEPRWQIRTRFLARVIREMLLAFMP